MNFVRIDGQRHRQHEYKIIIISRHIVNSYGFSVDLKIVFNWGKNPFNFTFISDFLHDSWQHTADLRLLLRWLSNFSNSVCVRVRDCVCVSCVVCLRRNRLSEAKQMRTVSATLPVLTSVNALTDTQRHNDTTQNTQKVKWLISITHST